LVPHSSETNGLLRSLPSYIPTGIPMSVRRVVLVSRSIGGSSFPRNCLDSNTRTKIQLISITRSSASNLLWRPRFLGPRINRSFVSDDPRQPVRSRGVDGGPPGRGGPPARVGRKRCVVSTRMRRPVPVSNQKHVLPHAHADGERPPRLRRRGGGHEQVQAERAIKSQTR